MSLKSKVSNMQETVTIDLPMRFRRRLGELTKVFLLFGLVFSSCTPTTGTRVRLSPTNLSKIKSIGVMVKKEGDFSVRLSREELSATGIVVGSIFGVVGTLVGAGAEVAGRQSADQRIEEQFKPVVGDYDPRRLMTERLHHYLLSAGPFKDVVTADKEVGALKGKESDALLEVTLREWGLRRCLGPAGENIQVGLDIQGKMLRLDDGTAVWERDELYLDGACLPWRDFLSRERLLKDTFSKAIDNLSGKIVNEILFP